MALEIDRELMVNAVYALGDYCCVEKARRLEGMENGQPITVFIGNRTGYRDSIHGICLFAQ